MLQITPQMKILVAVEPVDFRKGIDGLVQVCKTVLRQDPFGGGLFAFRNRRGTSLKVLVYHGQGFWLCQKRLSEGRFRWWPVDAGASEQAKWLAAHQLQVLIRAGNPEATSAAPDWRPVTPRT
jgi:transposase